tara:strand:+ start:33 stop:893 length:861 start_codon:yes stop_codon:yes gene_type:complete
MAKVSSEYPKANKPMTDDQLKKVATANYQTKAATETSTYDYPTEIVELPSKGKLYPEGHILSSGTIEMKYMTAKEEDILTNQSYIKKGVVLDKLFKALIVTPCDYNDLLLGDKNAVLIAARVLGYGKDYEITVTTPSGNEESLTIDLTKLVEKEIDWDALEKEDAFVYQLPVSNRTIKIQLLTQRLQNKIDAELKGLAKLKKPSAELTTRYKHSIIEVDGDTDNVKIRKFIDKELLAIDSRALRKFMNSVTPDVDLTIEAVDGETDDNFRTQLDIGLDFFWPDSQI